MEDIERDTEKVKEIIEETLGINVTSYPNDALTRSGNVYDELGELQMMREEDYRRFARFARHWKDRLREVETRMRRMEGAQLKLNDTVNCMLESQAIMQAVEIKKEHDEKK